MARKWVRTDCVALVDSETAVEFARVAAVKLRPLQVRRHKMLSLVEQVADWPFR